jgi:hypothetical protein
MKSLFDQQTAMDIRQRLENFHPGSVKQWGKMTAAQTMAHLHAALLVATGGLNPKANLFTKMMASYIKKVILSEKAFKPGLPTAPDYVMKEEKDFAAEKEALLKTYDRFISGGLSAVTGRRHPLFGQFTAEEWGMSQWKHFDHHLRQWGL